MEILFEKTKKHKKWENVSDKDWSSWTWQLQNRVSSIEELKSIMEIDPTALIDLEDVDRTQKDFNFSITPYYLSLMDLSDLHCPIRLQGLPSSQENIHFPFELRDFPKEEEMMPVPGLTHRYPDRAMLYTTHNCAMYCRFCTRKRKVSNPSTALQKEQIKKAIEYVSKNKQIREIILSGGDVFSFGDKPLDELLEMTSAIEHIEIIRLGTRNLVTLPYRVTDSLISVLKKYKPLYIHTHFNHPKECSYEALMACQKLREAGCVINNHTVLLKGVNDNVQCIQTLNETLLEMGVQPYYLYHCDLTQGSGHFRTKIADDLKLIRDLHKKTNWQSDINIPHYMIDTPGGGKVELI